MELVAGRTTCPPKEPAHHETRITCQVMRVSVALTQAYLSASVTTADSKGSTG